MTTRNAWFLGLSWLALAVVAFLDWRQRARERRFVGARARQALGAEVCYRCGGALAPWDGVLWPCRAHITYVRGHMGPFWRHEVAVRCTGCGQTITYEVSDAGTVMSFERIVYLHEKR